MILKLRYGPKILQAEILAYKFNLKIFKGQKKCRNNNYDNPLTSRRTEGGKKVANFWLQVHEKSILLVSLPVAMHLAMTLAKPPSTSSSGMTTSSTSKMDLVRFWIEKQSIRADIWFLAISVFSMLPLLIR